MKIAFNPSTVAALITPPNNKDITFDLRGRNIFARGVKFCGTDTWRDIKINNVSIGSNILDLRNGSNTTLTNTNGVVTINSTWRPVVDNLTSDSTTSSLSAKQGKILKSLIDGKSNSGHTHDDRYLKLTGGTMASNALITFADSGSWGTDKGPQGARGGLYWTGQSDYAKLYAEETAEDNLDLVIQFSDDNSNGLSIRNKANTQTSYISAGGVITTGTFKGNLDWSYITNKPSSYTPSAHTHAWNSLTHSSTTENQAILTNGKANGWKLYTLNISRWDNAANNAHSHANKSVLDGITSALVNNWNIAYTFVNTITGTDTDKVINKWDEIVNFLAGITEDNKLNTLLNSKLSVYKLADNTNVGAIKNNGIYYSTSDASSGTLVNSPFNNGFTLINMTSLDNGDDLRRSRLAFNAYGEIKVSNDRGLNNTTETWYQVLTSHNTYISNGSGIINGTTITLVSNADTTDGVHLEWSGQLTYDLYSWLAGWTNDGKKIKAVNKSLFATSGHTHDDRYVRAFGTSNDNIDSDWGLSFKTFDPIPSGTPPELNPNISLLNIGNNFNRRKLLAFIYSNDNIYYRRHTEGGFSNWRRLAFANEIPTSLKNPHALTISLNGTSQGPYDGSAAKNINITPGSIGAATSGHTHDGRYVRKWTGVYGSANKFLKLVISDEKGWIRLEVSDSNNALSGGYGIYIVGWGWHGNNGTDALFARCLYANDSRYTTALKVVKTSRNNYDFYFLFASGSSYPSYTINYSSSVSSIDCTVTAIDTIPTATWTSSLSALQLNASQVDWSGITNKPSVFNPAAHTHTVFKNNLMIKGTNGISDSASIHLGIGDSDTGFKWISDGVCQIYANNVAVGEWTSGGMNWFKNPTVNGNKVWNAGNDGSGSGLDADTLDGYHANSFLIDRGGNYSGLIYDLSCKSIFSGNNLSDAPTTGWVSGIVLGSNWNSSHYQHYLVESGSRWYTTSVHSNGKMTNWNTFAYLTDNVASATKLQTPRTIWGQRFDGTGNVDNTLRIKQTTGNYCEGIRIQNGDNTWATIILGATGDSGTNANAWSIHRKSDNNFAISRNSSDGTNGLVMTSTGMGLGTTAPTQRLDVRGNTTITGFIAASSAFINTGDSTLKVYSGRITDAKSDGNICLQTSIDGTDGQSHAYPTQYGARCNLVLLPRGGQVYIGTNPDGGNTTYKLYVNSKIFSNGGFVKNGSSDSYVLLGGGGHKAISDFATSSHTHAYLPYKSTTTADANSLTYGLTLIKNNPTNAAHTNHSAFLYLNDCGTPFLLQIPDSSVPYIYKRYYSANKWSGWFKLNAGYADSAGSVAWDNVTGKPSSFTPSSHTHSWTSITDKLVAGNEFNIVNSGFKEGMWFNYLPINDRSKTATITGYHFGNGATGYTSINASGFIKKGSNSNYVLLGDGGHKAISDFATSNHNHNYLRGHRLGYRHLDAGPKSSWSDSRLYIGYNGFDDDDGVTNSIGFYRSTGTGTYTRTLWAEINSNGLWASNRFGVNGQNTGYNFYVNGTSLLNNVVRIQYSTPNLYIRNTVDTSYSIIRFGTNSNENASYIFQNGPSRTDDGGANTMTIRNNVGYLRLDNSTSVTGLLTVSSGSTHKGIKIGNNYINAINGELIIQNNTAIRFGNDSWDYNVWAGLKYNSSNKTIYLGLADGSVFNANSALSGGSLRFPGISNVYATTFNGSLSGNASTATNADKLDGTHLNGIFTAFGNNAHNITATIGGVTKSFLVNWAADSDKLDGYHENSFLRYRGDTSTDLEATLWSLIGIKLYNNALPDNLTGVYNYGSVISLPGSSSRFEIYASHLSSNGNGLYYRSGWGSDKKTWLKFIDSSNIGSQSVNYANSAGNADKLDGYHANGLLTSVTNTNNGISVTVGGTTKSVSNISVNYASSAGSATKVIVNLHTTNDTNYPLVWSNLSNTNSVTENQLYKSWSDLYYNPKNKRLTVGGSVVASSFVKRGGTSLQLLRADGGIAAFNWSGQSGLPSWLWGGNNEHSYYVYNPSNFRVAYATSAGSADTALYLRSLGNLNCQTGRTLNYGDVYTYNTYNGNTGSPTTYTSVIGFGRGIAGTVEIAGGWDNTNLYWRSLRDCCEDWHSWRTVLDSSNYTEYINNYYWANVKISTSSSTTTSPTVSNLTATSSIRMGNIYLLNTNEINSTSGIHLNYQNSGNISLCYGGGKVGIGTTSPTYKLDVNGLMRASGFHHSSMNSDNYILLAGGGYKSFGGDSSHPVFLGYLNLDHGSDGTVSSSFSCLGYTVPFTYTRGGNYCKISIPDTTHQAFYIKAATASVNYSGGGMDTWTGNHRGAGAWWLHCYAPSSNEVRVKGFHLKDTNNDSWWGGNPLWSDRSGVNRITVCIFGYVTFR